MKAVLQRVTQATVYADGEFSGKCGRGLMILLGVAKDDSEEILDKIHSLFEV